MKCKTSIICALAVTCTILPFTGQQAIATAPTNITASAQEVSHMYTLDFNRSAYTQETYTLNGQSVAVHAYRNIVYVQNPKSVKQQSMNIFIPEAYFSNGTINGYTKDTAPIFMPNGVGGYLPGNAGEPRENDPMTKGPNAILTALSKGYVVAAPAIRGRTTVGDDGTTYVGKAPAFIVDYKAAVRYLRHNAHQLPAGDTEKIISNGTSAGGALSALLGATGNAKEYEPYLNEIGAAQERDDIFASSVYCPITNLEHADMAYEWMFNGVNNYYMAMWQLQDLAARGKSKELLLGGPPQAIDANDSKNHMQSKQELFMTDEEIAISKVLKDAFPTYVNSLFLKDSTGKRLTLDNKGKGSFQDYIKRKYMESAQDALNKGIDISSATWVKVKDGKVTDVDLAEYAKVATRMKAAPAFDKLDMSSAENDEFGTNTNIPKHFSRISKEHGTSSTTMADEETIRLLNPMNFIGSAKTAQHYRIRHGAIDRDTSLAIPAILALKLAERGVDVNFYSPWNRGHGGDYDLPELFDWIDSIAK